MPHNNTNNHEDETLYKIPYIEHEFIRYKESRKTNRITCALAVTNIAWFVLAVVAYIIERYEKSR